MTLPETLVQDADGFIRLSGHRLGLHHLVHFYNEGYSPEMLLGEFPTLRLAEIHKVIAFYLENRDEVDAYVADCRREVEDQARTARRGPDRVELRRRLAAMSHAEA